MNKMCLVYLGALLLALHLVSAQVSPNNTAAPTNEPMSSHTMAPNATVNTTSKDNGCGTTDVFTLLLPLAVAASLLQGCS